MTKEERTENMGLNPLTSGGNSLRSQALARYAECHVVSMEDLSGVPAEDVAKMIRELRVHQIELEMQNEELRRSQLALEESRTRFRDLYDHAPVGYCLVGPDGMIQDANRTLADMLDQTPSYLNSERFFTLIDAADQDVFYHLRRRIVLSLKTDSCELRMRRSDGSLQWIQLTATPAVIDGDTNFLRISLMNIDARVRAEAAKSLLENQLRESQKMEAVGTLAGGIAHDFNNILAVIFVNAEVAVQSADPATVPFVEEIQKAAARARELVRQILAFCRRQPTDRQDVSLIEVIQETIALLRSTMPARFELKFTWDTAVPSVLADSTQIEQVVVNLANNAMQAMDGRAGQLRIHLDVINLNVETKDTLELHNDQWRNCNEIVRMTFSDDGPGMEPGVVERIFEPFFTTKPVNEGTGLGLAVVHGIVRAHDGEIQVQTELGHGTTFTIYLPPAKTNPHSHDVAAASKEVTDQATLVEKTKSPTLGGCSILYVDDDQWVLSTIVRLLQGNGISVSGYTEPTDALNVLRDPASKFTILVTDYNMPGLSGLEFTKFARQIQPNLPVVITSGYIDEELRSQARKAGVFAIMEKPFTSNRLLDLLVQINEASENQ